MADEPDAELQAIEALTKILSRAPEHLKGATTYEILRYLAEHGDTEATAALFEITIRRRGLIK